MDICGWQSGRGRVGKTTTACSTAIELAKRREKVLILSTDPAHNLSDAFGQKFCNSPTLVNGFKNLYAMELDPSFKESFGFNLRSDVGGMQKLIPELLSSLPGIDEALGFAELMQAVQSYDYSSIVFDTAPTGHTMRLLTFPDIIDKALRKVSSYREQLSGTLNMLNAVTSQSIDTEEIQCRFDSVKAVTTQVKNTFRDPTLTTFICVCIPEFLSVYETERLIQELARQRIDCSNIVVNQVLFPAGEGVGVSASEGKRRLTDLMTSTETPSSPLVSSLSELSTDLMAKLAALETAHNCRRQMQFKYLQQISELYGADFHVVCMPLQPEEVRGLSRLQQFALRLGEERPLPPEHGGH